MPQPFPTLLKQPTPLIGAIVTTRDPAIAEVLSHSGLDWLFIDTEHAPLDIGNVHDLIRAAAGRCACIVRLASKDDEVRVKHALDSGADGIIVPSIGTAEDAQQIVRWAKYPPQGERSVGISRAHKYGPGFADYIAQANTATSVILLIETAAGAANIDSILAVPGVDAIFIGPYDLSASLGHIGEVTHPEVVAAIGRIKSAAAKRNMPVGIFCATADAALAQLKDGVKFVAVGIDTGLILQATKENLEKLKSGKK